MVDTSPDALRAALRTIKDPASGRDIVTAAWWRAIEVRGGLVQATLLTDRAHAAAMEPVRREAEAVLMRQPGVTNATAILTAHKPQRAASGSAPRRSQPPGSWWSRGPERQSRRCCCRRSRRSSPSRPARAASANPPSRSISPSRWPGRVKGRLAGRRYLRSQPAAHDRPEPQAGGARATR